MKRDAYDWLELLWALVVLGFWVAVRIGIPLLIVAACVKILIA